MAADQGRGVGRARERQHVQRLQIVEQTRGAAADDGQRSRRQDAGIDHVLHHALREPGGGGRGFDDHGHARQQRGRGLLPQAPGGEIEGIDEQRQSRARHLQVLRLEQCVPVQVDGVAVAQGARLAERGPPSGVLAERENRTIDVHGRVGPDGAGVGGRDLVVGIAVLLQGLRDLGQQRGARAIAHGLQGCAALASREIKARGQIQARGIDAHQCMA
ncbi:hypothetical protein D3C78_1284360 [compost metagenome]